MNNNDDDKIIPVEIRMLKFPPKRSDITRYLKYFGDRYEKYNTDVDTEPKIIVFRCYGWFDYLLLIFNPHIRCIENYDCKYQEIIENKGVMTTSFVLWMSKEYNNSENNANSNLNLLSL
jgi:hypothetical protein